MKMTTRYEERATCVARGAALLDRVMPHWYLAVDTSLLDMSSRECCILGQAFGDFGCGLRSLVTLAARAEVEQALACEANPFYYGFDNRTGAEESGYDDLAVLWTEAVQARREAETDVACVRHDELVPVGAAE